MSNKVTFDYSKAGEFIREHEVEFMKKIAEDAKDVLVSKSGAGNDFLGWIDLPVDYDKEEFARIKKAAEKIQNDSEVLLVIGIGGSYLGARAAIECLKSPLYNNLKKEYRVEIVGPRSEDLALSRPQFYMEEDDSFLSDHLYLATVEHLPKRSHIQKNSVLVCIGENLNLNYYRERMCLIIVKDRVDFFKLFINISKQFIIIRNISIFQNSIIFYWDTTP